MVRTVVLFAAAAAVLSTPISAEAQAWTAPAGAGSVGVSVQSIWNTGHRLSDGTRLPVGKSRSSAVYGFADYALSDRVSIAFGFPYVFAKFLGPDPAIGNQPVDLCGCWQHTWQDVGVTTRFNLANGVFGLTPSIALGVPSHDYPFRGEAVVGRGLKELTLAVDAGARLGAISDRLTVSGRYAYAIVERVVDVPNNRSNATLDGIYAFTRRFSVDGSLMWQRTHGGLRVGTGPPPPPLPWGEITTDELFAQHDRLLRDNNMRAGVTVSYSWDTLDVFTSYVHYLSGTDTHAGRAVSVGVSVPFEIDRR